MTLGSIIGGFKRKRKKYSPFDITEVVARLEGFEKYTKQIKKEKMLDKRKQERKATKALKKLVYQKIYSKKPVHNPYLQYYKVARIDPNLLRKYQGNPYSLYQFRHMLLPKSNYTIQAGQAWGALIKSFRGYQAATGEKNEELRIKYASATQKWAYMLEAPRMPDYPQLNLSALGFKNSKILKEFFQGYENEITGD